MLRIRIIHLNKGSSIRGDGTRTIEREIWEGRGTTRVLFSHPQNLSHLYNYTPDIEFLNTTILSALTAIHFNAACRELKYLKTCPGKCIMFPRDSIFQVNGYFDTDWTNYLDTRRSISRECFFHLKSLIPWRTNKQIYLRSS